MRFALTASLFLFVSLACASARAGSACKPGASKVSVTIDGGSAALVRALRAELTSELERGKLCAETPADGDEPLARIAITLRSDTEASVRIIDSVTKKTVEREVSVAGLPPDGRALPIAIAADELLRASWAEITLASSEASRDIPRVVRESVEPAKSSPQIEPFARHHEIGLRFTSAFFGGGQSQLGGVLFYRHDFLPWLSGEIFGYGREGLVAHAIDGSIHAHAVGGGLALTAHVLRVGRFRLGPELGADVGYMSFEGTPTGGATGSKLASMTSFGSLGLASAIDVAPMRVSLSALALAPFRAAKALDGSRVVTGASGAGFEGNLRAGVTF